jgi:hypothetical protein
VKFGLDSQNPQNFLSQKPQNPQNLFRPKVQNPQNVVANEIKWRMKYQPEAHRGAGL